MSYTYDRQRLLNGDISCTDLVLNFLEVAKKNCNNSFVEVFEDSAIEKARKTDKHLSLNKDAKPLIGLVISVKDLIAIKNQTVTGSSKILQGYSSPFNATAIQNLVDAGAIIIGRTNCDEFGMGSSNENSYYGPVTNHLNKKKVAGGSSGGAAVSVQEKSCHLAIGTDTGGSVRQPASFCGLYGMKPTYSKVSRYGLLAYASSFDTMGLISDEYEIIDPVLKIMSGRDEKDSTSAKGTRDLKPIKKVAYFKQAINSEGLQSEIKSGFNKLIKALEIEGIEVIELDFPLTDYMLETYYILTTAEASSNLSRYDGFRYGMGEAAANVNSLEESYFSTRTSGFGDEVKRRIFLGNFVLSSSYHDAYYTKAQKVRRMLRDQTKKLLESFDLILSPVTPTTAFNLGSHTKDPLEMYLSDFYTVHASVCGLPALSIPMGKDNDGMPFGLQLTGNDFEEEKLLEFADYLSILSS